VSLVHSLGRLTGLGRIPALRRAYGRIHFWLTGLGAPDRDVVLPCHGLEMLVINPRRNIIGRHIYRTGLWEPAATECVRAEVRPGMTAVDVGADIGYYTLLFAKLVGPAGSVLAFEPIPKALEMLRANAARNNLGNVQCLGFALFDRAGRASLSRPFADSRIEAGADRPAAGALEVELRPFDDWRREAAVGRVDFVKMDVEGAELNVLRGMRQTLELFRPALLIEVHPRQMVTFGASAEQLMAFLAELDYDVQTVVEQGPGPADGNTTVLCRGRRGRDG
jgi:FkbM family methyltransferase